jgi:hypothetical protein
LMWLDECETGSKYADKYGHRSGPPAADVRRTLTASGR